MGYDPDDYADDLGTPGWRGRLAKVFKIRDARRENWECVNGHPWMPETTRWDNGHKVCKICRADQARKAPKRKRRTSSW